MTDQSDLDLIRQSIIDTVAAGHTVHLTLGELWDLNIPVDISQFKIIRGSIIRKDDNETEDMP